MNHPKYLTGILLTAAGLLFLLAGIVRRLAEPLWLIIGTVSIVAGVAILRRHSGRDE